MSFRNNIDAMAHCSYIFIYGNPREVVGFLACLEFLVNIFVIFAIRFSLQCSFMNVLFSHSLNVMEKQILALSLLKLDPGLLITGDIVITHIWRVTVSSDM